MSDNPYAPAMQANAMAQQRQQMMAQRLAGPAPTAMPGPNGPPGVPGVAAIPAGNPMAGLDMQGIARAFRDDKNKAPLKPGEQPAPDWLDRMGDRIGGWFGGSSDAGGSSGGMGGG